MYVASPAIPSKGGGGNSCLYLNLQIKRSLVLIFFLSSIEWRRQFQLTETFREFVRRVLDTIIDFLCQIYSVVQTDVVYAQRFIGVQSIQCMFGGFSAASLVA